MACSRHTDRRLPASHPDEDIANLRQLGVESVFDLRRAEELETEPGPLPFIHLALPNRSVFDTDPATLRDRSDGERWLLEDYLGMLAGAGPVFGELFNKLATSQRPAVFHCMGGKDRTGLTAALLLLALGVDRETVLDDYELTGLYRGAEHVPQVVDIFVESGIARPAAEGMLSAPRWAMAEAIQVLDGTYGGIERYLMGQAEMQRKTLTRLQEHLTGWHCRLEDRHDTGS